MTSKDNIIQSYNKMGFLSTILIDVIDELKDTNQYKQKLKMHLNQALIELEKINKRHCEIYQNHGEVEKGMHSIDAYNITGRAYDKAVEFLFREPHEVVMMMDLVEKIEKTEEYKKMKINYKPALK